MEDKMIDYAQPLLEIKHNIKRLENALLKRDYKNAEAIVNDSIVEHLLLRTWTKHADN